LTLQLIFSGSTLVLCAFFFVYFHLYIRRRTSRGSILAGYQEEVDRLIAEIDHATDRDAQLVEERITALRKILDEADRRIALMSRDMDKRRSSMELYTALGTRQPVPPADGTPAAHPALNPVPDVPARVPAQVPAPAAPGSFGPGSPEQEVSAVEQAGETPAREGSVPEGPASGGRPLTQRVVELSRQGFADELIAARLGLSLSEVKLALAVSRRRRT
jgi:hypothetical protein